MLSDMKICRICKEIVIPKNDVIIEDGEYDRNELSNMLIKYKNKPDAIQFIAEMLEE